MGERIERSRPADTGSIELRRADTNDGIAMWRLSRGRPSNAGLSPFFYMVLIQHFGKSCMVVERNGEAIGFIVATPPQKGVVRVLDLCLRPSDDGRAVAFQVLATLCALPGYLETQYIEPALGCDASVKQALRDLLGAGLHKPRSAAGGQSAAAS